MTNKTQLETAKAHVTTWRNRADEVHPGYCATLTTDKVGAWGCTTEHEALEQMAAKLEKMAAEIRKIAATR
jgi:hypothetical protein